MGCDIHMYLEYSMKSKSSKTDAEKQNAYWVNFGSHFNPGRHYDLFGFLSKGVRGGDSKDAFTPKGIPENIGAFTFEDYYMFVIDDDEGDFEGCVNLKTAIEWVENYGSDALYRDMTTDGAKVLTHVASPDWHSMNVITLEEYKLALDNFGTSLGLVEFLAILAAMENLEANGHETRLVFWFDN